LTAELIAQFEKQLPVGPSIRVSLRCPANPSSLTVLFGPSGSGKTTTLRCLAGLEWPELGRISFGDETWFDRERNIFLRPQQRRIGYLFQEDALFPHLNVVHNIAYGLRSVGRAERQQRVREIIEMLGLGGLEHRHAKQISGGERQRVALARTIVCHPHLLLLDEPLSALDIPLREQLRRDLRRLLAQLEIPAVLVTHDRVEALSLADYMVVFDEGRVRQSGPAEEVFSKPADLTVARIVGVDTVERARIVAVSDGLATVQIGSAQLAASAPAGLNGEVYVCIHAGDVILDKGPPVSQNSARNRLTGRVESLVREGSMVRVSLDCGFSLKALVTNQACQELVLREGEQVTALLKAPAIHLVPRG
jgi:molybdate transport system ATP-binding protein